MATKRVSAGSRSLVTLFDLGSLGSRGDRELLECFQTDSGPLGQEAFRILVERHGPMVLGLCRSLVRDQHEAEDAFQATFLVLVRKAASIQRKDTLGPWLYGVAAKVARRARGRLELRRKREVPVVAEIPGRDRTLRAGDSTEQVVHEEIARLPDSIGRPLILCCLQGLSYDLAAQRLGVNQSTVRGRLERARKRLSARLRDRGVSPSLCAPAIESVHAALTPLPSALIESTVQFSLRWSRVAGLLGGGAVVPETVSILAQGVLQSMLYQTIRVSVIGILAAGVIGTVVVAQQGKGTSNAGAAGAAVGTQDRAAGEDSLKRGNEEIIDVPAGRITYVDYETNEALVSIDRRVGAKPKMKFMVFDKRSPSIPAEKPKGAIELTSVDEKVSHARIIKTGGALEPIRVGDIVYSPFWSPNQPSRFAVLGKIDLNRDGKDDRAELKRMIEEAGGAVEYDLPPPDVGEESGVLRPLIDWYVTDDRQPLRNAGPQNEAELLSQAKFAERVRKVVKEARLDGIRPMSLGKLLAYLGDEPRSRTPQPGEPTDSAAKPAAPRGSEKNALIRRKLETRIDAQFPKGATLETLLKHIRQVTRDATYPGIPIFVDPVGLTEAGKSMGTEVELDYKQQPIEAVLKYTLRPLGMSYCVRDGFVWVSSRTATLETRVEEIDRKLDVMLEMLGRLQPAK